MPTYRLDPEVPKPLPPPPGTRRPRGWGIAAAVGVAAILSSVGVGAQAYLSSPQRVGERFLAACGRRDPAALRALMDDDYQRAVPPAASQTLLQELHRKVPRAYRITMAGTPSINGLAADPRRYAVRAEFLEPEAARQSHRSFVVTLRQRADGEWRVAFGQTYEGLFSGLYGPGGATSLKKTVAARAGAAANRLFAAQQ